MATQSRKTGPEFFAGDQSAENMRRKFIEAPLEGALQSVLSSGLELANLLSILPDAFIASQQRELERVKKSGKDNDPRVAVLQTSIEQANVLRTTAQRGQARVQRTLVALADSDHVFHGFVSDAEFAPLKGLTVRLIDSRKTSSAKPLTAATDDEGYFRIPLEAKSDAKSRAKSGQMNLSERITNLFAGSGEVTNAASSSDSSANSQGVGQVEILKKGKVVHRDPALVARGAGSVYREYVIAADKPPSASDFRDFVSDAKDVPQNRPVDSSGPAAATSKAGAKQSQATSWTASEAKTSSKKASKKSPGAAGSSKMAVKK